MPNFDERTPASYFLYPICGSKAVTTPMLLCTISCAAAAFFQPDPAQPSAQHKGFHTINRHLNPEWIDDHHSIWANHGQYLIQLFTMARIFWIHPESSPCHATKKGHPMAIWRIIPLRNCFGETHRLKPWSKIWDPQIGDNNSSAGYDMLLNVIHQLHPWKKHRSFLVAVVVNNSPRPCNVPCWQ